MPLQQNDVALWTIRRKPSQRYKMNPSLVPRRRTVEPHREYESHKFHTRVSAHFAAEQIKTNSTVVREWQDTIY